jgi:hypothetical protein
MSNRSTFFAVYGTELSSPSSPIAVSYPYPEPYKYRVYQNDLSGFEVDYIHKYSEQNYKCK